MYATISNMRVTIKEVAQEAGVSLSTVSRVLHDSPKITDNTKLKVNDAINKLGYYPNHMASALAGKPTKTIGIVLPNNSDELFKNTFFINAMRGISIYAQKLGYFLMYSFSKDEEEEVQFIEKYIQSGWVSGVVLLNASENDKCINHLRSKKFPFVIIGSPSEAQDINWVDNNNYDAMSEVVDSLVRKGKRNIAFIGGSNKLRVTKDRYSGYLSVLESNGLEPNGGNHFFCDSFTEENGYISMKQMLKSDSIDAVVTTDDLFSFGVLEALKEEGRNDIMVTGFNNSPRSAYLSPTLTTVEINADKLGENAAALLISHLENKKLIPSGIVVNSNLIERETTKGKVL